MPGKRQFRRPMGDVWKLESSREEDAADDLNLRFVGPALKGDIGTRQYLENLWEEDWSSIERKLKTEGSVWYVWWMDGVRGHYRNMREIDPRRWP